MILHAKDAGANYYSLWSFHSICAENLEAYYRKYPEALDDLAAVLEEMDGYERAGKLTVTNAQETAEIRCRITDFTAAIEGKTADPSRPDAEKPEKGEFALIRKQLIRQKELITGKRSA